MIGRIRLWIILASTVGLVGLVVVSWLSYRSTQRLVAANQRTVEAHKLIEELTTFSVLLDDAESTGQNYILNGKAEQLRRYEDAVSQLDVITQVLRYDLAPDANRSKQLREVEDLFQAWLDVMKDMQMHSQGSDVQQRERGDQLNDEIRQKIAVVQNEERNDLLEREQESRVRAHKTILVVGLTALLGSGLLLLAAVVIYRLSRQTEVIEKMKDEFVSVVSHELRTPLTSIKGSLGLLASGVTGNLPPKASEMAQIALVNVDRLTHLVDDILDLQRIASGRITIELKTCGVGDLMKESAESVRLLAEAADVRIATFPVDAFIQADQRRMVQAFVNLLGNAIKFSPRGSSIDFIAEQRNKRVIFQVKDEGRGIPEDKLETIFERFQQIDASDAREKGGTGLGLAICRSIVEQQGGKVWAESALGRGSSFFVELPIKGIGGAIGN